MAHALPGVTYRTLNVPTLHVPFRSSSVRAVLPSNWQQFTFPQGELQDRPSVSSDQLPSPGWSRTTSDPAQRAELSSLSPESFKKQAKLQRSRLLRCKLLDKERGVTVLRKKRDKCSEYYWMHNSLCTCSDVHCLMEILEFPNYPEEWGLFIDTKGLTLKAALLQNAKATPFVG